MKEKQRLFCIAILVLCSWTWCPGVALGQFGELPPGAVSTSRMGPADEIAVYVVFDPAMAEGLLPEGLRFRTLEEFARSGDSAVAEYLRSHPEHKEWARSFLEVIRTGSLEYDGHAARPGKRGGMAVWYATVARVDSSDTRPRGWQSLALGTWLSDKRLVEHMRAKGYAAEYAEIEYRQDSAGVVYASLKTDGLNVRGQCRLTGAPRRAAWDAPPNLQTIWTPRTLGRTFEIVTFYGHIQRDCTAGEWELAGDRLFVKAFRSRAKGGTEISGTEHYANYVLCGGLYRR